MENPTIVEYFIGNEGHRCGYCKSPDTNVSHGMWAHSMNCQDYQDLIDRGWRRSGKYCYKPTMNVTCCPMYTIKCKALEFQMSNSHKKVIKRVNRYLITGKTGDPEKDGEMKGERNKAENIAVKEAKESGDQSTAEECNMDKSRLGDSASNISQSPTQIKRPLSGRDKQPPRPGDGADPSKSTCKKAKQLRLERRMSKQQMNDGPSGSKEKQHKKNEPKTLEDFLNEPDYVQNCAHKLETRLVRSTAPSQLFKSSFNESHTVYSSYQRRIHGDPPGKPNQKQFTRFLCDSPLSEEHRQGAPPCGYGSFHQQYLLDGKIIAVGVIDILPSCVSSVYLYYDPDYDFLSLGTYTALRELAFVRELSKTAPSVTNYYLGFYIHTCPKMIYKGQYTPSFLVCPQTYSWIPIEKCRPLLDANRYCRFEEDGVEEKDKIDDISQVLILHKNTSMPFHIYQSLKKMKDKDEANAKEYAGLVGKACAERMLLILPR